MRNSLRPTKSLKRRRSVSRRLEGGTVEDEGHSSRSLKTRRRSRLPIRIQKELIEHFVAGETARATAQWLGMNRHSVRLYFHKLRELIACRFGERELPPGPAAINERRGDNIRRRKRDLAMTIHGSVMAVPLPGGRIRILAVVDSRASTRQHRHPIEPRAHISGRIGARQLIALHRAALSFSRIDQVDRRDIATVANFWGFARRHLARFKGVPRQYTHLYLAECAWRFSGRHSSNLPKILLGWAEQALL